MQATVRIQCLVNYIIDLKSKECIKHQPARKAGHAKWYVKLNPDKFPNK